MSTRQPPPYREVRSATAVLKLVKKGKVPRPVYDQCVAKVEAREISAPLHHDLKGLWKVKLAGGWRGRVRIEDGIALIVIIHPRGAGY